MVIRLARVARLVMATRGARRLFERLGRAALVAALVVLLGAAVAYGAEHAGRFAGVMIMLTGIGVLGMLAGSLASFFRIDSSSSSSEPASTPTSETEPVEPDTSSAPDALTREVAALREQITGLAEEIARLAAPD